MPTGKQPADFSFVKLKQLHNRVKVIQFYCKKCEMTDTITILTDVNGITTVMDNKNNNITMRNIPPRISDALKSSLTRPGNH